MQDLNGKRVVVTGGSEGLDVQLISIIPYETAHICEPEREEGRTVEPRPSIKVENAFFCLTAHELRVTRSGDITSPLCQV
jgi:hypothetical protein